MSLFTVHFNSHSNTLKINFDHSSLHSKVTNSIGGSVHQVLAGRFIADLSGRNDPTPPPSLAAIPLLGMITAPIGELWSVAQVVIGVAGIIIFFLPAMTSNETAKHCFKKSIDSCIAGSLMACIYPIMFISGHTISLFRSSC